MIQASMFDQAQRTNRKPTQAKRVLTYLRARGKHGVLNYEFVDQNILRYGSRINELRKDGWTIEREYMGKGVYKYRLVEEGQNGDSF